MCLTNDRTVPAASSVDVVGLAVFGLPLLSLSRVIFAPFLCDVHMGWRQLQTHLVHRVGDNLRYREIAEPFVVGRDDVPRRTLRTCPRQSILIRLDIFWPKLAFGIVAFADLPVS